MKMIDILNDLIEFKTIYPNYKEIDKIYNYIENYYKNTNLYIKKFSCNGDTSMYIANTNNKEVDVLFVGHIDVVDAKDDDFKPKIIENKLYGRGSFDMKGHVAVMLKLLKDNDFNISVGLLLTSDEERGGINGTKYFLDNLNYSCKIAIVPDAGNNFQIIDEEKGVLQIKVSYKGKEAHSSQVWNGDNAIKKIIELYNYLIKKYPLPKSSFDYKTSINISKISGGNLINKVPHKCYAIFDIRHIVKDKKSDILNCIKEFNDKFLVEVLASGDAFQTIKNNFLYNLFLDTYKDYFKKDIKYFQCESASDGRFFYSKNIPCILMNASGGNLHSENEYIDIKSLDDLYNLYLMYLKKL